MIDRSKIYTVVMAGGRGERFWPQSRQNCPKQLLRLIGNLTLIEQTTSRMLGVTSPENCLVVTNNDYVEPMRSLLPQLPPENIIGEPVGRDTGGCLALACGVLDRRGVGDDAVVIATPADHNISDRAGLNAALMAAAETAAGGCDTPVLIGVPPEYASTGYGYIKCGEPLDHGNANIKFCAVDGFVEKPSVKLAEKMLQEGGWRWNSGIFVWTRSVFKRELAKHAPELAALAQKIAGLKSEVELNLFLSKEFAKAPNISIDYAVLEKTEHLIMAESSFDWADIGSWNALRKQIKPDENNNYIRGNFAGLDVEDCIVIGDSGNLIAAIDVKDLIIVNQDDVTLVCNTKSAQRVKELVKKLDGDISYRKFL